jgi:ketosteroid isomerase-like protein
MSQENVEIVRRLWLVYVRRDYEASIAALDDAVELWSDPRANMETGLLNGREAVVASIGGFISSFDDYWCEEPEELIDVGDWVVVVVRSGGRGRTSGIPVSQVWTVAYKLRRGRIVRIEFHPDKREAMTSIEAAGLRE